MISLVSMYLCGIYLSINLVCNLFVCVVVICMYAHAPVCLNPMFVCLSICLLVFSHLIVLKLKFLPCRDSNASTTNEKNAGLCLAMAARVPMLAIKFTLRQIDNV